MKSPSHSSRSTSNNERSDVNSPRERKSFRKDQHATSRAQEGARGNPLGLRHPARTPMPEELRTPPSVAASPTTGRRVAGGQRSGYVSALAARAERNGTAPALRLRLEQLRVAAEAGRPLLPLVADGSLDGWATRCALTAALPFGVSLADWDRDPGRTRLERVALVMRVLGEVAPPRRGGWRVTR